MYSMNFSALRQSNIGRSCRSRARKYNGEDVAMETCYEPKESMYLGSQKK
jgi:hypothetical protein